MLPAAPTIVTATTYKEIVLDTVTTADPVADIIGNYYCDEPDYSLAAQPLTFNDAGVCTNPEICTLQKQALTSQSCPVWVKNAILEHSKSCSAEFKKMLNEIMADGYVVDLSDTRSNGVDISGVDFSGGKLNANGAKFRNLNATGTNFSGGSVSDMNIFSGILSGSVLKNMPPDQLMTVYEGDVTTAGMELDESGDASITRIQGQPDETYY